MNLKLVPLKSADGTNGKDEQQCFVPGDKIQFCSFPPPPPPKALLFHLALQIPNTSSVGSSMCICEHTMSKGLW